MEEFSCLDTLQIKVRLKKFERHFEATHGRKITRADVREHGQVALYTEYARRKRHEATSVQRSGSGSGAENERNKRAAAASASASAAPAPAAAAAAGAAAACAQRTASAVSTSKASVRAKRAAAPAATAAAGASAMSHAAKKQRQNGAAARGASAAPARSPHLQFLVEPNTNDDVAALAGFSIDDWLGMSQPTLMDEGNRFFFFFYKIFFFTNFFSLHSLFDTFFSILLMTMFHL